MVNTNSSVPVLPWVCRKGEKRAAKVKKDTSATAGSKSGVSRGLGCRAGRVVLVEPPSLEGPSRGGASSSRRAELCVEEVKLEAAPAATGIATGLEDFIREMKLFPARI